MSTQPIPNSFEDGMCELEALVKKLEEGRMALDEALVSFERGTFLRRFCEEKLNGAKLKVDQISQSSDGGVVLNSFETMQES